MFITACYYLLLHHTDDMIVSRDTRVETGDCDMGVQASHGNMRSRTRLKTIDNKISAFKQQRDVVLGGRLTLLTLSSLEGNYKRVVLIRKGAVDCVLSVMDDYDDGEITQTFCAILESLSRNSKDHLNADFPKIVSLIQKLADEVISADPSGRDMALCALFNLCSQKKNLEATGKTLLWDVRKALAGNISIRAIADVLRSSEGTENVAEVAMSLLWRISAWREEDNIVDSFDITEELIDAVIGSMRQFESLVLLIGASCGASANLSVREDFSPRAGRPRGCDRHL
jgi:hypothetical protein